MRALITGGAGFIGSHLAEALLAHGDEAVIIDDLSTGSIDNIAHLKGRPRLPLHASTSVTNEPLLAELVDQCDVVFHLAAAVGVKLIVEQPVHTIETNVHGTEVVLKHANKKKKLVVIASTSEVYGKSTAVPFHEDADLVLGPTPKHRWAYACSKAHRRVPGARVLEGEEAAGHHRAALQHRRARGRPDSTAWSCPTFVRQALAGQPITVFGDGTQSRSFTYVGDVVRALRQPRSTNRGPSGEVFNVGNGQEITIRALAERVKALTGSASRDRDDSLRPGVRGGFRGHAAPRARHLQDPRAHRLRAEGRSSTRSW